MLQEFAGNYYIAKTVWVTFICQDSLSPCSIPDLCTIRFHDRFTPAIRKVYIIAMIIKTIHFATFVLKKIINIIGPVIF